MTTRGSKPVAWLIASLLAPPIRPAALKEFGPIWGGWQTWRQYQTDNVVCVDPVQIAKLIEQSFHTVCTLHIPSDMPPELRATPGIKVFSRPSALYGAKHPDLVALFRLAASTADVVYLLGMPDEFVLGDRAAISAVVAATPAVQWVQLNSETMYLPPDVTPNYTQSDLQQVLKFLHRR